MMSNVSYLYQCHCLTVSPLVEVSISAIQLLVRLGEGVGRAGEQSKKLIFEDLKG